MSKISVPDWYCANIHASIKIELDFRTGNIRVSPCTLTPFSVPMSGDVNAFQHPRLQELRKINLTQTILPGNCAKCYPNKLQTLDNRASSNEHYLDSALLTDQSGPTLITFLISRICNLACTTCGPDVSSKWSSIIQNRLNFSSIDETKLRTVIRDIDLSNLQTVHIFGGEPFADPINQVILEELSDAGDNITVWYDTNATFIPNDSTQKLWEKFKLIRLKFSIDGVDDSFEYLRWPAKWSSVTSNINTIKSDCPSNVMFSLRPTIGLLNLHVIQDLRNWFQTELATNREGNPSEFEYNGTYGIFDARNMPREMRDSLMYIYDNLDPVRRILNTWTKDPDSQTLINVKKNLAKIDALRKTNYQKSLPYLFDYFH